VDGEVRRSLKTDKKMLAEARLRQYIRGEFRFGKKVTVGEYYEKWIETKKPPVVRESAVANYKMHFGKYVLPEFGRALMSTLTVQAVSSFRSSLLAKGLSLKTCRNIIDAFFRALWRDAMIEGIVEHNPFALLQWPRLPRLRPDPFTSDERDRILAWWEKNDFFFFPYVAFQFATGARPSETHGLKWQDVDLDRGLISINKGLVMGEEDATKTAHSDRIIPVDGDVRGLLAVLPSKILGIEHVFVGKRGNPMSKKWAEHNWKLSLEKLGIRHRKFYCTRHTFITELVRAGENLKAIADYCGTSVAMIERDYCGRQGLSMFDLPSTNLGQPESAGVVSSGNNDGNGIAGLGFEPRRVSTTKALQRETSVAYAVWQLAKSA